MRLAALTCAYAGVTAQPDPVLTVGEMVAKHYQIAEAIGRTVYRARDTALGRDVAIKIHRAADDDDRLASEAFALARLAHPNVVTVYEIGAIDGRRFVAMEYVRGGTSRDWLAKGRDWREIVALFARAGDGLAAAHRAGLVHRDFKPENVLVGEDGRPRVVDFAVVGGELDARCDQFAFCATLWEALYGERSVARARIPARLRDVLARGLAAAPGDRFADMPTLLLAIRDATRPRRARWIALALAGIAVVTAAGLVYRSMRNQAALDRCEQSAIATVWDEPHRTGILASFLATGLPYAPTTWRTSAKAVDHFVATWQTQQRDECVAFEVEHTEPEEIHERRAICLERARIELDAVVQRLGEIDRGHMAQSGRLVGSLPDLAECERAEPLASADPARHAMLTLYFTELSQVESLAYSGRYAEANKQASALLETARALGSRRAEAEAEYLAGQIAAELGDYPAATRLFDHALVTAEAAANDLLVAGIATELVGLIGARQARYADAQPYVGYARAAANRVGQIEPRAKASQVIGRVELLAGHFDEAERQFRSALALAERPGNDASRVASICSDLSQLASARGRPAQAEPFDRRALAIYTAELGAEHPVTLSAAGNLGATLAELGRYDEARALYAHVLEVTERTTPADSIDLAYALNNVAAADAQAGELARARRAFERALAIFEKRLDATHPTIAAVVENLADIASYEVRLDDAARLHGRVLELRRRRLGNQHPDIARSLLSLAEIAFEQHRIDAARTMCDQARAAIIESDARNSKIMVDVDTCFGVAELEAGRAASAVTILERAVALAAKADDTDPGTVASVKFALARALPPTASARAIELARSARELFANEGMFAKRQLAEADAWLRKHSAP